MWLVLRGCPSTGSGCAHSSRAEPEGFAELGGSVELAGFLQASASAAHSSSGRALVNNNSRFLASHAFVLWAQMHSLFQRWF